MTAADSTLLTLNEAAARLQVDTKTLRRYIAAGRVTGYRLGPRAIRVDAAELDELLRPIATVRSTPAPAHTATARRGVVETPFEHYMRHRLARTAGDRVHVTSLEALPPR